MINLCNKMGEIEKQQLLASMKEIQLDDDIQIDNGKFLVKC